MSHAISTGEIEEEEEDDDDDEELNSLSSFLYSQKKDSASRESRGASDGFEFVMSCGSI